MIYYPTLFYGINLGGMFEKTGELPGLKEDEDYSEYLERLEKLAKQHGLEVFISGEENESEFFQVHIGYPIQDRYSGFKPQRSAIMSNAIVFNTDQIVELRQSSSELIKKLKNMGFRVNKKDLALFGNVGID